MFTILSSFSPLTFFFLLFKLLPFQLFPYIQLYEQLKKLFSYQNVYLELFMLPQPSYSPAFSDVNLSAFSAPSNIQLDV